MSEPKEWKDMPDSIKGMIVKQLDLPERNRLKMCSKADKQLVDSIPFEVDEVEAGIGKVILRKFKEELSKKYKLANTFYEKAGFSNTDKTLLSAMGIVPLALIHENCQLGRFAKLPEVIRRIGCKIKTKKVILKPHSADDTVKWLQQLDPCVEEIIIETLYGGGEVQIGVGILSVVINAKKLSISKSNDIDDNEIVRFKATHLDVKCSKITEKGVNMLMKKWIEEDYPIESKIKHSFYKFDLNKLLDGLKYEAINDPIRKITGRVVIDEEKELDIRWWKDASDYPPRIKFTAEVYPLHDHSLTNWNEMPSEIKKMIIERMNDKTKMQLKICSKSDKSIVESSFCCLTAININGSSFSCFDDSCSNRLSFTINDNQHIVSIQLNDKEQDITISKTTDEWMKKALSVLLSRSGIQIDEFFSLMEVSANIRSRKTFINLQAINFYADLKRETVIDYLRFAAKRDTDFKKILVNTMPDNFSTYDEIGYFSVLNNARELTIYGDYDITEHHVMDFESTNMKLSPVQMSEEGVNRLIWKMINKDYPIDTFIKIKTDIGDFEQALVNLKHKKFQWKPEYMSVGIHMKGNKQMTIAYEKGQYGSYLKIDIKEKTNKHPVKVSNKVQPVKF